MLYLTIAFSEVVQVYETYYVTPFLNPNRHSVLLAAKVHWTFDLSLATSGKGLTIAPLKYFKLNCFLSNVQK